MSNVVPVRKMYKIKHESKVARKSRLNNASEAATVAVKDENVFEYTEAAELSHQLPEAVAVHEALLDAMNAVCSVDIKISKSTQNARALGWQELG